MPSNSFGEIFRITTFGESHGPGIGVVIDGCPAGLEISEEELDLALVLRAPGKSSLTSPRKESDRAQILSGVFEGKTTGAPIAIFIKNQDADPSQYEAIKNLYRPGHANFTYLKKYGIFDYRGGGRASARETAVRVAAGAVAKKLLSHFEIDCVAFLSEVGTVSISEPDFIDVEDLRKKRDGSSLFCPDHAVSKEMIKLIEEVKSEGDSIGGVVACVAEIPVGLGEPIYRKIEALLGYAMLSIPATRGFEIGAGFMAAKMRGSEHNDPFTLDEEGNPTLVSNYSGGVLGGISTGQLLYFRVPFKPTSSIRIPQQSVTLEGEKAIFELPGNARHDPCVAIRGVPVVEAMTSLVLADLLLMHKLSKIDIL